LAELDKLAKNRPSLAGSCAVVREILPALFTGPIAENPVPLDTAICREKLTTGVPLLRGERFALEPNSFRARWLAVCRAVERENPAARSIADAFLTVDSQDLLLQVVAGRPESVHTAADEAGLDPRVTATVLRLAALPGLAQIATELNSLRDTVVWKVGYCPICGSWPLLGEFRGLEQTRFLRCGWCASEWQFSRIHCPFCDNRDHKQLSYLHVDGEENRYRAAVCNACKGYVKMMTSLSALSPPQILVTDLATVHLDLAAADRGYFVM
jgi:FdhE protein